MVTTLVAGITSTGTIPETDKSPTPPLAVGETGTEEEAMAEVEAEGTVRAAEDGAGGEDPATGRALAAVITSLPGTLTAGGVVVQSLMAWSPQGEGTTRGEGILSRTPPLGDTALAVGGINMVDV